MCVLRFDSAYRQPITLFVGMGQGGGSDGKGIYERIAADIFVGHERVDLAVLFYSYGIGCPVQTWIPKNVPSKNFYFECCGATLYEARQAKVRKLVWMLNRLQFNPSIALSNEVPVPVSSRLQRLVWRAVNLKIEHFNNSKLLDEVMNLDAEERTTFTLAEVDHCLSALAQPFTNIKRNVLKVFIARISWLVGGIEGINHFHYCICGADLRAHLHTVTKTTNHPHVYKCPLLAEHFKSEFGDFSATVATAKARHFIL